MKKTEKVTSTGWSKDKILAFVRQNPESSTVEYMRPFEEQNPELNRRICQQVEWNILSMANLTGGLIFIGVNERADQNKLLSFKASLGQACVDEIRKRLHDGARPQQPRINIQSICLNHEKDPASVYVIEVEKSDQKHFVVTPEGLFYPMKNGTEIARLEIIAAHHKDITIDADINEFIVFLKRYILPMFPGAYLAKTVFSLPRQEVATLDEKHHTILVKPNKAYRMRLEITRPHIFTHEDKEIVKRIIQEAYRAENTVALEYQSFLRAAALEIALCKYLSPQHYATIAQVLNGLNAWSIRTYEGRSATFGIKIDLSKDKNSADNEALADIMAEDYFATLSDGRNTLLEINAGGQIMGHHSIHGKSSSQNILSPLQFANMAEEAGPQQAVIVLNRHGEILIFINQELKFAKRRGIWLHFNHAPIIRLISGGSRHIGEMLRKAVYETLLDVAFAKTGGTICICSKTGLQHLLSDQGISIEDIFGHEDQSAKSRFLQQLIHNRKFQELPRSLRQELMSIDGATLVDNHGTFLCVGAIVKVRSGSPAGGRQACTLALAKYGPAFKVSSDGMISGYLLREHRPVYKMPSGEQAVYAQGQAETNKIMPLFTIA